LKIRGTNKARVAIARKLLTIAFQILRDQRAYEPRGTNGEEGATISRLS
jgi:ABC-type transport system involved in Fe-S cluster assembly fused permease/ATPase subunit